MSCAVASGPDRGRWLLGFARCANWACLLQQYTMPKQLFLIFPLLYCLSCGTADEQVQSNRPKRGIRAQEPAIRAEKAHSDVGFFAGFKDRSGSLWFATRGRGVFCFDGQGMRQYTTADGLSHDDVTCIGQDSQGQLWFGMPNGVCRFDGETFAQLKLPWSDTSSVWLDKVYPVVNPNQVMSILEDGEGRLWFGTNGAGVYRYDGERFEQFLSDVGMVYEDGQNHNIVLSMCRDGEGSIWFSSLSHAGVSRYDGKGFEHFTDLLSDDFIRTVYCNRDGQVMVGTHGNHAGGMDVFDGQRFRAFHKTNDGFRHNNVLSILQDRTGVHWIGSGTTELSRFDGEHFTPFEDQDGRRYDLILFVLEDPDGKIWFGGPNGLWRYNGDSVESMAQF